MRKLLTTFVLISFMLAALPLTQTGCTTAPSQRVVAAQTLGAVGITAKASIDEATKLLARGQITVAQFQNVANFYDKTFQPTYLAAVAAVKSDLSSVASPDVLTLAAQLATLIAQLTTKSV